LTYQDLQACQVTALRAEGDLLIFDSRDPHSYAAGHLADAQPVSDAALRQLIKSGRRQQAILVYCYHGNSSRELCRFIAGLGFSRVYNLVGGWQGWQQFLHSQPRVATLSPALAAWLGEHGFAAGNLNARIDNGMAPLMLAALRGESALVEELLALGADPNHVNDDEHHALWFACVHGDEQLVAKLIAHGARVDNQNVNGATCAIYAASTGKLAVLRRLVEAGADLSLETSGGYTALESASTLPVLKYLRALAPERPVVSTA
jgi:rhodanese-related sulfurtransferase